MSPWHLEWFETFASIAAVIVVIAVSIFYLAFSILRSNLSSAFIVIEQCGPSSFINILPMLLFVSLMNLSLMSFLEGVSAIGF